MATFLNSTVINDSSSSSRAVQGQSLTSFASALGVGIAVSAIQLLGFVLIKDKIPKIYQPKAFLVPARQRSPPIPLGPWKWLMPIIKKSDDDFLRRCGLDAYFLSRYLYVLLKILFPVSIVALPLLLAIDATGENNIEEIALMYAQNQTKGLDILTMSNVSPKYYNRLWAHCLLAIGIVGWSCYVIVMELQFFIRVRQSFLTSPQHRLRASASTVLVRGLPRKYDNDEEITELFDVYPGGIRNVWVNHNYNALDKIVEERNKIALQLEKAETQLIQKCVAAHKKNLTEQKTENSNPQLDGSAEIATKREFDGTGVSANNPGQVHHNVDEAVGAMAEDDVGISDTDLAGRGFLGKGFGAVNQGIQNLGRGIGGGIGQIGQLGNRFAHGNERGEGDEARSSSRMGAFGRALSRRRRNNDTQAREEFNESDIPEENERQLSFDASNRDVSPTNPSEGRKTEERERELPFDMYYDEDNHLQPRWRDFIEPKDRPTMRVKNKLKWVPAFMNPAAIKVDTIYHCRKELARLNRLVEKLQDPSAESRFPTMRSAFIQFNNQAAAHMACQSLAHHSPTYMAPRMVEISPDDVLWQNMSIPGWAQYVRTGLGFVICVVLLAIWTPAIAASSAISQFDALRQTDPFRWAINWPSWSISLIQGLLPIILINVLVLLLGIILRQVIRRLGAPTNMRVELSVQKYFFTFTFIQYFIIVTIASAISRLYTTLSDTFSGGEISVWLIPRTLAQNMPAASTYFLSNILLQSLSQSAGGLLQPGSLIMFWLGFMLNSTARKKFNRRTSLQTMNWGTTYPIYTVYACIALIYSIISPLILPLSMIGFGIWWISTRYQMLYVYKYTSDTGGLLYPMAIKQLFTGLIVLELYLVGYFTAATVGTTGVATPPKGQILPMIIIVVVLLVGTIIFYMVIKVTFDPLLEYLPITLEDDAVKRDEEFAKLLAARHRQEDEDAMMQGAAKGGPRDTDDDDGTEKKGNREDVEAQAANEDRTHLRPGLPSRGSWASERRRSTAWSSRSPSARRTGVDRSSVARSSRTDMLQSTAPEGAVSPPIMSPEPLESPPAIEDPAGETGKKSEERNRLNQLGEQIGARADAALNIISKPLAAPIGLIAPNAQEVEAQQKRFKAEADEIYGGIPDDLENLTVDQRDALLSRAFRHRALRAKRPCVWMPRDELGISDDEVKSTALFTQWIWISNEKQRLDDKGKCVYEGSPPDFDEVDLIQL